MLFRSFIAIPLVAFFIVEAQNSIQLLGGEKYISATLSMQILMPILVISGFSNITGNQILIPMNREKYFMFAVSLGALVNLGLNLILMPKLGIIGASMATLFAELTQMTVQFIYSYKYLAGNISKNNLRNVILATVIATIILILVKNQIVLATPFLSLFIAGSTFFAIYLGVLLLLKEEVAIQLLQFIKLKP